MTNKIIKNIIMNNKIKSTFKIEKSIKDKFKKLCQQDGLEMSYVLEGLMKGYIKLKEKQNERQ